MYNIRERRLSINKVSCAVRYKRDYERREKKYDFHFYAEYALLFAFYVNNNTGAASYCASYKKTIFRRYTRQATTE